MDNLRLILLILGCLIVAGIYLWEVFYKTRPKKKTDMLNAVDETPDTPLSPVQTNDVAYDNYPSDTLADLGSLISDSRNATEEINSAHESINVFNEREEIEEEKEDDQPLPLQMSVKDYEASISEDEHSDIFSAIEEDIYEQENEAEVESDREEFIKESEDETSLPDSNKTNNDILVLYITSPSHITFNGLLISKAADEVGMVYGHMNIFHHFGPGKLHSGQPLFSLANMHEPGSFDLGRMADLKTKGLALFMYSPASIDASIVFELFLNTTQRLAEILGGKVRTSDNEILNNLAINSLREKAESLSPSF